MPKDTFLNLPEEKQNKIFDAAVEEFSARRFSEASINQIVKNAGIARGSFYQYFADKEDLYLYMITEIGKQKMNMLGIHDVFQSEADFFENYLKILQDGLAWAQKKPEYTKVGMLMELDDSNFIQKLRAMSAQGFQVLRDLIIRDQKRGLIKPDHDPDLIVDIIYILNMNILKDYMGNGDYDIAGMTEKARQVIWVIKEGVAMNNK
jgi:TetR/AcrR family transcriptional regulator